MKFILTLHRDEHMAIHIVGLASSIEEGIKLFDLDPKDFNMTFVKQQNRLTLSMLGDHLDFFEVEYDDGLLNQYLRKQKLTRVS